MPPLYRMPVFYVAALVLTAAIGLGSWVRARRTSRRHVHHRKHGTNDGRENCRTDGPAGK